MILGFTTGYLNGICRCTYIDRTQGKRRRVESVSVHCWPRWLSSCWSQDSWWASRSIPDKKCWLDHLSFTQSTGTYIHVVAVALGRRVHTVVFEWLEQCFVGKLAASFWDDFRRLICLPVRWSVKVVVTAHSTALQTCHQSVPHQCWSIAFFGARFILADRGF